MFKQIFAQSGAFAPGTAPKQNFFKFIAGENKSSPPAKAWLWKLSCQRNELICRVAQLHWHERLSRNCNNGSVGI
jgi:hypothetical protein